MGGQDQSVHNVVLRWMLDATTRGWTWEERTRACKMPCCGGYRMQITAKCCGRDVFSSMDIEMCMFEVLTYRCVCLRDCT